MSRDRQPTALALSARPLDIIVRVTKTERGLVNLLNWLAVHNAELMRERPDLPLLYESGAYYARERTELWCDYAALLEQGHEDCDGLAAARAGELMAWGAEAMTPEDGGYAEALRLGLDSIPAWVILRTKGIHGQPNLYHCIVLYQVGNTWWRDDPSARLGMFSRRYHPYNREPAAPVGPLSGLQISGPLPRLVALPGRRRRGLRLSSGRTAT